MSVGLKERWDELTPEVILGISRDDVVLRDAGVQPILLCLEIWLQAVLGITLEIGDVEVVFGKLVDLRQELPRVGNGFFLWSVT